MGLTGKNEPAPNLIQVARGHQKDGDPGIILTTLEKAVNWARKGSLWPMTSALPAAPSK